MTEKEREMPMREIDPLRCQEQAKKLVADYVDTRYGKDKAYDTVVTSFVNIGKTWKATLTTSLPNSAFFTVEYYALKQETTLKVYAMTETVVKHSRGD